MEKISVKNLGPIKEAKVNFSDLTIFVGPQASGKSILLQLIKLIEDKKNIRRTLEQFGFSWGNEENLILDRYFGEGMSAIWNEKTEIQYDKKAFEKSDILPKKRESYKDAEENLFYVPAQRVICLNEGWPRFFTGYESFIPYVLRHFSETLRQLLETSLTQDENLIFPQKNKLKAPLREFFDKSIFHGGKLILDKSNKKMFRMTIEKSNLPFMAWSAGQKEFMPLLLSFYWLCPPSKVPKRNDIKYVVIEEPEMGLHPQAINSVILQIIDLLSRGYKVIVSTHSTILLEFAWAFTLLKQKDDSDDGLFQLFDLPKSQDLMNLLGNILKDKTINTYFFNRIENQVLVKDISSLDAGSEDDSVAEWGGLSTFSRKASDVIARVMADE